VTPAELDRYVVALAVRGRANAAKRYAAEKRETAALHAATIAAAEALTGWTFTDDPYGPRCVLPGDVRLTVGYNPFQGDSGWSAMLSHGQTDTKRYGGAPTLHAALSDLLIGSAGWRYGTKAREVIRAMLASTP